MNVLVIGHALWEAAQSFDSTQRKSQEIAYNRRRGTKRRSNFGSSPLTKVQDNGRQYCQKQRRNNKSAFCRNPTAGKSVRMWPVDWSDAIEQLFALIEFVPYIFPRPYLNGK